MKTIMNDTLEKCNKILYNTEFFYITEKVSKEYSAILSLAVALRFLKDKELTPDQQSTILAICKKVGQGETDGIEEMLHTIISNIA